MKRLVILLTIALLLIPISAAAAIDVNSLADQAALRHYAVEGDLQVDVNGMESLVAELPEDPGFYFVALAEDPSQGADYVANDILGILQSGTVIVVGPSDLGAVSSTYTNTQLGNALDASITQFDTSYVLGFRVFAETLLDSSLSETPSGGSSSSGSGGSGGIVVLLLLAGLVLIVVFAVRRGRKSDAQVEEKRLSEARTEIQTQLDAVANRIVELSDQIDVADKEQATGYYREASATFSDIKDSFEKATNLSELEDISTRLDHARWQLEAADAIVERRPVPEETKKQRTACFFDPAHRGGTEQATITTPAGSQTVSVCHACAERLRRGDSPIPRSVPVNGRKVPVPMAPAAHGGGGIDMASVFKVIVAGMGAAAQYRTSRGRVIPFGSSSSRAVPRARSSLDRIFPISKSRTSAAPTEEQKEAAQRSATKKPSPKGRARRRRS